jgi:hypothetical protein
MGMFDKLFGRKSGAKKVARPEPSPFTDEELSSLTHEINVAYKQIISSHKGLDNLKYFSNFPVGALLSASEIVELCQKNEKDAYKYIISYYDGGGQFLLHRKQCQYMLSILAYKEAGANIPNDVISFVYNAVGGKDPDDCTYLIKLEHLW